MMREYSMPEASWQKTERVDNCWSAILGYCTSAQLDAAYRVISVDRNSSDDVVLEGYERAVSNVIMIYKESMTHTFL